MKIGIITIQDSPNYGACLQTYALYEALKKLGGEVEVVDLRRPTHNDFKPSRKYKPYGIKKGLLQRLMTCLTSFKKKKSELSSIAIGRFEEFNRLIRYSRRYFKVDELYSEPPIYDVYVTGSDQCWNPSMKFCIEPYFLTFAPSNSKKISYATSIGGIELANKIEDVYIKKLADYNYISVREKSASEYLEKLVSREVEQVDDPTFLLSADEWCKIYGNHKVDNSYILLFTLKRTPMLMEYALTLSRQSGKKLVYLCLGMPHNQENNVIVINDAGPAMFLSYIANADIVITDSFHGTALSIILGARNFYSYVAPTNKRGSRISDMLDQFCLSSHMLDDNFSLSYEQLESNRIDRKEIEQLLSAERKRCFDYLRKAIYND